MAADHRRDGRTAVLRRELGTVHTYEFVEGTVAVEVSDGEWLRAEKTVLALGLAVVGRSAELVTRTIGAAGGSKWPPRSRWRPAGKRK